MKWSKETYAVRFEVGLMKFVTCMLLHLGECSKVKGWFDVIIAVNSMYYIHSCITYFSILLGDVTGEFVCCATCPDLCHCVVCVVCSVLVGFSFVCT